MFKPFPLFVGLRYTRAKRRSRFMSLFSAFSVAGFTLGVTVLIIVLSVMNGFEKELRTRILGMIPHGNIIGIEPIDNWPELVDMAKENEQVIAASPYVDLQGMLSNRGEVQGVLISGIEPDLESQISIVNDHMVEGQLNDLKAGEFGIILGLRLARQLGVNVGEKIIMVLPEASVTPGGIYPRLKRFTVVGIFEVRAEVDAWLALIHVEDAAVLAKIKGKVHGLRLKVADLFKAHQVVDELTQQLPANYFATDWSRSHGNLFNAIQLEKNLIGLLLCLIIAVAAFNVVSSLVMLVADKKADIAILRTLGASPKSIMTIFMVQGLIIGFIGIVIGVVLGVLGALTVSDIAAGIEKLFGIQFLSSDIYFVDFIPSDLRLSDVIVVTAVALIASFLSTLYPAWQASRVQPAEALRYE